MIDSFELSNGNGPIDYRVTNGIAITVTLVWAIAWLYGMISADYEMPKYVHAAFMIMLTGIFSLQGIKGYRNGQRKE